MLKWIAKRADELADIGSVIQLLRGIALPLGGGVVTLFLLALTEYLDKYSPLSYWIAFLVGAVMVALILSLGALFRERLASERYLLAQRDRPQSTNPLKATFSSEKINLVDFYNHFGRQWKNHRFENCDILGPANVLVFGFVAMERVNFHNCDFIKIRPSSGGAAIMKNAVAFNNLTISDSKIYGVTFFATEHDANAGWSGVSGIHWIN